MSLIILSKIDPRGHHHMPPRWRVQCPRCADVYVIRAWPCHFRKTKSCARCRDNRRVFDSATGWAANRVAALRKTLPRKGMVKA